MPTRSAMNLSAPRQCIWLVSILTLVIPSDVSWSAEFDVVELGTLGGTESQAFAINRCGEIAGDSRERSGAMHAFRYRYAQLKDLGIRSGSFDINGCGVICGIYEDSGGRSRACYWDRVGMNLLPEKCVKARAINDLGMIVGDYLDFGLTRAFLYHEGAVTVLPSLGGIVTYPTAINNRGEIVGYAVDASTSRGRPFLIGAGGIVGLPSLDDKNALASDINEYGTIVGYTTVSGESRESFQYKNGTLTRLAAPNSASMFAYAVNDREEIVGTYIPRPRTNHAFLIRNGKFYDLNNLVSTRSGWTLQQARDLNNRGEITGWGINSAGETRAFLLVPTRKAAPCGPLRQALRRAWAHLIGLRCQ